MRKPRNTNTAFMEVYSDGSGYELVFQDRSGLPTSFIKTLSDTSEGSIEDIEKLRDWLNDCLSYIKELKKRNEDAKK